MSRTEELTTKLRTLSYDHERLRSLHRNVTETAANAEREMNVHKSRLTCVPVSLPSIFATQISKVGQRAHSNPAKQRISRLQLNFNAPERYCRELGHPTKARSKRRKRMLSACPKRDVVSGRGLTVNAGAGMRGRTSVS